MTPGRRSTTRRLVPAALIAAAVVAAAVALGRCACGGIDDNNDGRAVATPAAHTPAGKRAAVTGLASISGTVRSAAGPIPGARACAVAAESEPPIERCTTADARGAYAIAGLAARDYVVVAGADGFVPRRTEPFALHDAEARRGVDFELVAGGALVTGTVSDVGGGPIAHAHVVVDEFLSRAMTPSVETDAHGTFRVWASRGEVALDAYADGYAPARASGESPGDFAIVMTPGGSVGGTVLDAATRAPVANAKVVLDVRGDHAFADGHGATTDADGQFFIDGVRPDRYFAVATTDHGLGRSDGSIRVGYAQHVGGVQILMRPAFAFDAEVVMSGAPPARCAQPSVWLRSADHGMGLGTRGPDGHIRFGGLLPGAYEVSAECKDPPSGIAGEDPRIQIVDRDLAQTFTLPSPPTTPIRGRVLSADGTPIVDAAVNSWSFPAQFTRSRADGSYELVATRGRCELVAIVDGVMSSFEVDVGAAPVAFDLVIPTTGAIAGRVTDDRGQPVADVEVTAKQTDYRSAAARQTDATGAFRIAHAAPGDYAIDASPKDGEAQHAKITVRAGETATVAITVERRGGAIDGVVVDADGQPAKDAAVALERELAGSGAPDGEQTAAGADGAFAFSGLPDGAYTVHATSDAGEVRVAHVKTGDHVRVTLQRIGGIAGVVRRGQAGVLDVRVTVRTAQSDAQGVALRDERFYGTDGRYHVDGLAAGSYTVTAGDGDGDARVTVDVVGGQVAHADIALDSGPVVRGRLIDVATRQPIAGLGCRAFGRDGHARVTTTTDADGRFAVAGIAADSAVVLMFDIGTYGISHIQRSLGSTDLDLGDLYMARRGAPGAVTGKLGAKIAQDHVSITAVEPGGPAAAAGLVAGDVVTSIDGIDLASFATFMPLDDVATSPPGTQVTLGLARGATVTIMTAAH